MQIITLLALPVLLVLEAAVSVERWAHETWALLRHAGRSAAASDPLESGPR